MFQIFPKGNEIKYKMTTNSGKFVYLQVKVDPATDWIEICALLSGRADLISNQIELDWFTCYLLSIKVRVYRKNEFLAEFREW